MRNIRSRFSGLEVSYCLKRKRFKYFGLLLTSEGRTEQEFDWRTGTAFLSLLVCCGEQGAEPKGKALCLLVSLTFETFIYHHNCGK